MSNSQRPSQMLPGVELPSRNTNPRVVHVAQAPVEAILVVEVPPAEVQPAVQHPEVEGQTSPITIRDIREAPKSDSFTNHIEHPVEWSWVWALAFPTVNFVIFMMVMSEKEIWGRMDRNCVQPFVLFAFFSCAFHFNIYRCSVAGLESSVSSILAPYWNQRSHILVLVTLGVILELACLVPFLRFDGHDSVRDITRKQYVTFIFTEITILLMMLILILPLPKQSDYFKLIETGLAAMVTSRQFTSALTFVRSCTSCLYANQAQNPALNQVLIIVPNDELAAAADVEAQAPADPPSPPPPPAWWDVLWSMVSAVYAVVTLVRGEDDVMRKLHYAVLGLIVIFFACSFFVNAHAYDGLTWVVFTAAMTTFAVFFYVKTLANAAKVDDPVYPNLMPNPVRRLNTWSLNWEVTSFTYMMLCLIIINSE